MLKSDTKILEARSTRGEITKSEDPLDELTAVRESPERVGKEFDLRKVVGD